jgi:hypothetical protein
VSEQVLVDGTDMPLIKEYHVFISDDKKKSAEFVHHCIEELLGWWEQQSITHKHVHFWTDGCASEFRSRHVFVDRALLKEISASRNMTCDCNYFCSGHGKGEWDAVGGTCKHHAAMHVIRNQDAHLGSAKDLYDFLVQTFQLPLKEQKANASANNGPMAPLKRRIFHYVPVGKVEHDKASRGAEAIEGTLETHQVAFPGNADLKVYHRTLSCFCDACMTRMQSSDPDLDIGPCANSTHVPPFSEHTLRVVDKTTMQTLEAYFGEEWECPPLAEGVLQGQRSTVGK